MLSPLELVEPFQTQAVIELIVVECAPGCYRFEVIFYRRSGRWTPSGTHGPRTSRSPDPLAKQLKSMGAGRTVTRPTLPT